MVNSPPGTHTMPGGAGSCWRNFASPKAAANAPTARAPSSRIRDMLDSPSLPCARPNPQPPDRRRAACVLAALLLSWEARTAALLHPDRLLGDDVHRPALNVGRWPAPVGRRLGSFGPGPSDEPF